ncbi:MAG TPA: PAS domain S-box protein, partial [Blastocatellia bacterium]|nr:PAS domain S-box protein [Blastocatellia bacterium]
ALTNGGNYRAELRFILPDGRERWGLVRGQIFFDQFGQPERIVGVDLDITERKKAEEERQRIEHRFRALIEHSADGIAVIDAENNILYLSPSVATVEGYEPEELIGRNGLENTHPEDLPYVDNIVEQLVANPGVPIPVLWRRRHKKGHWIWLEGVATNLLHDPAVKGIVTNYRDVTERKRAEEMLLRSQKLEALGTLAGGIAHDFNNVLLAISGNAALAIADLPQDHKAQESLSEIIKAASRASEMIKRILAFSSPHDQQHEVVHIQSIIEEALKLLRPTIPARIELRTNFASDIPLISADSTKIHQITINLATNAAHAIGTREGLIEFQLETINVGKDLALTPGLNEGRYIRLKVDDNGCGMDRATMNRIFDPYFTTKSAGQGTGLGLSVVHGLVKSLGGSINVYSQPDKGTSFHLYFPIPTETIHTTDNKTDSNKKNIVGHHERILYVDDEESLVTLITRTLKRLGYHVTGFSNPFEALEAFRSCSDEFDVVITDLSMPGLSGFELARELMAIRPNIPIIMTSGYLRPEDQEAASHIGIRELILKPDTVDELGQALDRIFQEVSLIN